MIEIVKTSNNVFNQEITLKLTFGEVLTVSKCFDVVLDLIEKESNYSNPDKLLFNLGRIINNSETNNIIMIRDDAKKNISDMNTFLDTQLNNLGVRIQMNENKEDLYISYDNDNIKRPYDIISREEINRKLSEKIK